MSKKQAMSFKETLQAAGLCIDDDDGADTIVDWQSNVSSDGM